MSFFNSENEERVQGFEPMPAGDYTAMCESIEMRETKAGTGTYAKVVFNVLNDQFAERKLFMNYNFTNENPKAATIGRSEFANFIVAAGIPCLETEDDLSRLQGQVLVLSVGLKKRKDTGDLENVIKKYYSREDFEKKLVGGAKPQAVGHATPIATTATRKPF